jgi:hypothetical protein
VTAASGQFFETRGDFPIGPPYEPVSIAIGDFNRDGKLDIATAPYLVSSQIAVMLGNGDGTFGKPTYYAVGQQPFSIATADLNNDGNPDLVVANSLATTVSILLGNPDGAFQVFGTASLNSEPSFVSVGDFNADNIPDLVVADSPYVTVLLGKGDGTFGSPLDVNLSPQFPDAIATGDFNHDGRLDISVCSFFGSAGEINVLLGRGDGTFQPPITYQLGLTPDSIMSADLNGDGNLDLLIADGVGSGLYVMLGRGDGTFGTAVGYSVDFPNAVAIADVNGDGNVDVVAASNLLVSGAASVLLGNGDGTLRSPINYSTGKGSAAVAVGDLNGDHKQDITIADDTSSYVAVLLNTGTLSLSPSTPLQFQPQFVGTTSPPQTVTLTNRAQNDLTITSTNVTGNFLLTTTCGKSVPPGERCQLKTRFQPKASGLNRGLISIFDSASTKPQIIELFGVGK